MAPLSRKHVTGWRFAAAAGVMLCVGLAVSLSMAIGRRAVALHVVEIDSVAPVSADLFPTTSALVGNSAVLHQVLVSRPSPRNVSG